MTWTVILRPRARADIRITAEWFGNRSRAAEVRWRNRLLRAFDDLERDPFRYPVADETMRLGVEIRELLIGRRRGIVHRVLFTVETDTVTIHRIRHAAQDHLAEDEL